MTAPPAIAPDLWSREEGKLLRALEKERHRTDRILAVVEDFLVTREPARVERIRCPALLVPGEGEPANVHLQITDMQAGKYVKGVGGMELLERYMDRLVAQAVKCIEEYWSPIYEFYVHLTGDLIENCGMFGRQVYEVDHQNGGHLVIRQVLEVVEVLERGIRTLHENTSIPMTVTSTPGNHGRRAAGGAGDISDEYDNFDTLVALLLKRYCSDLPITWDIPEDRWFTVTDSMGWSIVSFHGNQISGSTPASMEKWVLNHEASGTFGVPADVYLKGHLHHPFTLPVASAITVIQGGSMDGGSPWYHTITGKGMTPPSQELFFVSKELGVHGRHTLHLEPRRPRGEA